MSTSMLMVMTCNLCGLCNMCIIHSTMTSWSERQSVKQWFVLWLYTLCLLLTSGQ